MVEVLIPDFRAVQAAFGDRRSKVVLRRRLVRAITLLVDVLDLIDGDADLEPSLGSGNPSPPTAALPWIASGQAVCLPMADHLAFAHGGVDDREADPLDADDGIEAPIAVSNVHRPHERRRRPLGYSRWDGRRSAHG